MARSGRVRIAETTLERLGRILTDKWGIKVIFEGNRCETTGKVIYLPVMPDAASEELIQAMHGHLDHEAGHCIHTDFSVMQRFKDKAKLHTAWNALEDPRQERLFCKMYPGAKVNLERGSEWAWRKVAEGDKGKRTWDQLSDLGKFLYAGGVYTENNFSDDHWFLKEVVEPDIMALVKSKGEDLFRKALEAPTTHEVADLAAELLARLNEVETPTKEPKKIDPKDIPDDAVIVPPQPKQSPQQKTMFKQPEEKEEDPNAPPVIELQPEASTEEDDDGMGGEGEEGEGDEEEGEGEGSGGGEDEEGEEGTGGGGASEDAGEDGEEGGEAGQPGQSKPAQGDPKGPPRNFNPSDAEVKKDQKLTDMGEQLQGEVRKATSRDGYLIFSTAGDVVEPIKGGSRPAFAKFNSENGKLVSPMRRTLVRLLNGRSDNRWEYNQERGRIDKRRLYRLITGTSNRIFKTMSPGEEPEADILLAVDHSGSMNGEKIRLASQVVGLLGQTFEPLKKVNFAVYGWSTGKYTVGEERRAAASAEEQALYSRWGNLWIGKYKGFEQAWNSAGPAVMEMPNHLHENTYDGESIKKFAQMLLARKAKRKILLIFNDGQPQPSWADDHQAHVNYAHAAAKEVESMVETVVFGIMTDAVKDIYSRTVVIKNLNDLPKLVMGEISNLLLKKKNKPVTKAA